MQWVERGIQRMRNRIGAVAVASAVVMGLLTGCSGSEVVTAVGPSPTVQQAAAATSREARIDPTALPSLSARLLPSQSFGFTLSGDDGLRTALDAAISEASAGGRLVRVFPVASSPELVGFRLQSSLDGVPTATSTFWYSVIQRQVVPSQTLLGDGTAAPGGVSFTPAGAVYFESVVDGGWRSEVIDPARLSDLGRMAQAAAVTPTDPAQPKQVDCSVQRCIALTFDDGPSEYTPTLLKTLAENDAHATFYILGRNLVGREQTLQAMAAAGHQIGNHTYNHPRMSEQSQETVVAEIAKTEELLAPYGKNGSETFRPPYGLYNDGVVAAAKDAGYSVTMWSIDPADYRTNDPQVVVQRVLAQARPGAVLLSHDTIESTVAAYQTLIPQLRKAGYELVTVDQLLGAGAPGQVRRGR